MSSFILCNIWVCYLSFSIFHMGVKGKIVTILINLTPGSNGIDQVESINR